jgi:hypothetical protein
MGPITQANASQIHQELSQFAARIGDEEKLRIGEGFKASTKGSGTGLRNLFGTVDARRLRVSEVLHDIATNANLTAQQRTALDSLSREARTRDIRGAELRNVVVEGLPAVARFSNAAFGVMSIAPSKQAGSSVYRFAVDCPGKQGKVQLLQRFTRVNDEHGDRLTAAFFSDDAAKGLNIGVPLLRTVAEAAKAQGIPQVEITATTNGHMEGLCDRAGMRINGYGGFGATPDTIIALLSEPGMSRWDPQ